METTTKARIVGLIPAPCTVDVFTAEVAKLTAEFGEGLTINGSYEVYLPGEPCGCWSCDAEKSEVYSKAGRWHNRFMILCPDCGNKRCPKANHHDNACTQSNDPGQEGSAYKAFDPKALTLDELEAAFLAEPEPFIGITTTTGNAIIVTPYAHNAAEADKLLSPYVRTTADE